MTIKYILHTGETVDKSGATIWIDGDQLARLYGVAISQCLILNPDHSPELDALIPAEATHLHIRKDGEYPQCF